MVDQYAIETVAKRHYLTAEPHILDAGLRWYDQSLRDVRELSRLLPKGSGVSAAAGILAALSPQTQWVQNWLWATKVAKAAGEGRRRPVIGGFPKNRDKAWRIAQGERAEDVLRGPKVTAFWKALAGDPHACVLDLWMFRAFGLPESPPRSVYERTAEALAVAAYDLGVQARQLQAVIWLKVRGIRPSDPAEYFRLPVPPSGNTIPITGSQN